MIPIRLVSKIVSSQPCVLSCQPMISGGSGATCRKQQSQGTIDIPRFRVGGQTLVAGDYR